MSAIEANLKDARDQLSMVLSFFPRVDAKLSTVLAIDTAMLAALSASVPPIEKVSWCMAVAPIITFLLIVVSYVYLYRGGFPNVKGGQKSIVYFKEIASRTEANFIEEYAQQTQESLRTEILGQVWRNSEILSEKFSRLKIAFIFMALAAAPWAVSLAVFALARASVQVMLVHP
jgi:hypothetical protein